MSILNKKRPAFRQVFLVGREGLEPSMTGPESVVLPLHQRPIVGQINRLQKYIFFKCYSYFLKNYFN